MLTEQQYEILREFAEEIDKPLSVLIREALQQSLLVDLERRRKHKALAWMTAQGLPVDDWEVMEHQIESRWEEDQHE
jgi:predicted transcriptional regulator